MPRLQPGSACRSFLLLLIAALAVGIEAGSARLQIKQQRHALQDGSRDRRGQCPRPVTFEITDAAAPASERSSGLSASQLRAIMDRIKAEAVPFVRVEVVDLPCAAHGCCNHSLLIRPQGSDAQVLEHAIGEYHDFLDKLPRSKFGSILEGGGNVGVATMVFASLYPQAAIVVLEPEPSNCMLLKANTLAFPNVRVHCKGLWTEATQVAMKPGGDGKAWGWHIEVVEEGTEGAVQTVTVPELLAEHGLDTFDFVKLDIEGAEFQVFGEGADLSWLQHTQLMAMEVHGWAGSPDALNLRLQQQGFGLTQSGEYSVFSRERLHSLLARPSPSASSHT